QNYDLLKAAGTSGKPVLLKRGPAARLEEFLMAAEYILVAGNPDVILCERGIRTFETAMRNTLDLAGVAWLQARTHLPVIVDPSHGIGVRSLVPAGALASLAVGADGLIVEVHPIPEKAASDGAQSLSNEEFSELMDRLRELAPHFGRTVNK
ncbi:3-deoxy-7-phosphoheptulonate synthase, partial [bacterium]|nr:3-deoxy-7-phosphoheptulonate synthase [bacterium]